MSLKPEIQSSKADTLKLVSAGLIVVAAFVAFYAFSDLLVWVRVLGLLIAVGGAAAIALTTELGASIQEFILSARTELRKVVWPSRTETLQTTLAVVAMVIVMGLFLWLLDMLLLWLVKLLTG